MPPFILGWQMSSTFTTMADTLELKAEKQSAHLGLIRSVAFSPDGKSILVTFVDRNATDHPGGEWLAVVSATAPKELSRAPLGDGKAAVGRRWTPTRP